MRQLLYAMFKSINQPSFQLWRKEIQSQNIMKLIVWKTFFCFLSVFFLTFIFVKSSHIYARIFFVSPKNILKQTWSSFNTKLQPQLKDGKSSNQLRHILGHFCLLVSLISWENNVKGFRITTNVMAMTFEGFWGETESKK